jgi:diguanylate cyclase (GGDEF)-like protein
LFNRRYLEESLEREIYRAGRKGTPLGVVMLDIDHFKQFNDTFGHEAGDAILHEIGVFLQRHVRSSDIACRYGGEEFTLIMPETSLEVACQRAEHLREAVKHVQVQHVQRSLGSIAFSFGVAVFPDHGSTAETLLRSADTALYQAKSEGRNRVCVAGQ